MMHGQNVSFQKRGNKDEWPMDLKKNLYVRKKGYERNIEMEGEQNQTQ